MKKQTRRPSRPTKTTNVHVDLCRVLGVLIMLAGVAGLSVMIFIFYWQLPTKVVYVPTTQTQEIIASPSASE